MEFFYTVTRNQVLVQRSHLQHHECILNQVAHEATIMALQKCMLRHIEACSSAVHVLQPAFPFL